ncbi:MAG: tetratricopeptide repeat protein [Bacteroidia bacterium]|nr:PD40 domain-containing protein [Bacteroidia bacterium]MCZ2277049.1 tetratricopeptide repeat protein [Bacteroidia bacterium]
MRKTQITLLPLLLLGLTAFSQAKKPPLTKDQVKQARSEGAALFKNENFKHALKYYYDLVEYDKSDIESQYRLGICLIKSNINKKKAAEHLKEVVGKKDAPKDINYYLGIALMYNHEFIDAIDAFEKYREEMKGKPNPSLMVERYVEWCNNAMELMKNPVNVTFFNPGKGVNSPYNDFQPVCSAFDSVIYFSSNRKGTFGGALDGFGEYVTDIFSTAVSANAFTKAKNVGTNLNNDGYNEALYLTMNSDKMLVYNEGGSNGGSEIALSELKGRQWLKPISLSAVLGLKSNGLISGASITQDGKTIYFSAELKGGKGGKDIWKIEKDTATGKWSAPINLGDYINTPYNEINPFLFFDHKTLFFASQGHNSMGGYDLFRSYQADTQQDWSKAENLGFPINTVFDDETISVNGTGHTAYIAALRDEGIGEKDIYRITTTASLVSPQPVLTKIFSVSPTGLAPRDGFCIVTVRATGEMIGTFSINPSSGIVCLTLSEGQYRLKIRSPRNGMIDADFDITGSEPGFIKELHYKLE